MRRPRPRVGARRRAEAGINGSWWRWARPLGGAAILGAVVTALGGGTVVDALRATDRASVAVGTGLAVLTTVCAAWRWRLVARGLHVELAMPSAVAACYRSQFLNVTLPGGVLGDVGRGLHQGREVHDVGRGLRTVGWERASGQVVLVATTAAVLVVARPFEAPAVGVPPWVPVSAVTVVCLCALTAVSRARGARVRRVVEVVASDVRSLLRPKRSVGVVLASLAVIAGHVATFIVAARAVGVAVGVGELVPLALLVLLVSALPLNLAGWGPREGAAAWAFAAAGLGASRGLAVAVAYGAIVFVATLPGAVLLLADRSWWSDGRLPSRAPGRAGPQEAAPVDAGRRTP